MDYNITYREKNGGIQIIVSYKDASNKWRQKSKQGFENSRIGKKQAKEYANKMVNELKETLDLEIMQEVEHLTIGELKEEFLEHIKLHREYGTWMVYKDSLASFQIDNIEVKKLKLFYVQQCVNELIEISSTSTIKRKITIFNSMLRFANSQYDLPIISLKQIIIPNKSSGITKKALTVEEQKELLKLYKNKNTDYYLSILLGLKAGLRIGEIMGLTWDDIDFKNLTININKQWKINKNTKVYGFGTTKSKNSNRIIPISTATASSLYEIKKLGIINKYHRLITNNNTSNLTRNLNRHLNRYLNISMHELRHTYATNLISNGIDFKTTAQFLGHDIEQTMKIYSHVTKDMIKNAANIIDKLS